MPIVLMIKPTHRAMNPLMRLPLESVTAAVNENTRRANISAGPNFKANLAIGNARNTINITLIIPPIKEAQALMANALPAWPLRVMGYPSQQVTIAEASPGVLIRIDAREPPNIAP